MGNITRSLSWIIAIAIGIIAGFLTHNGWIALLCGFAAFFIVSWIVREYEKKQSQRENFKAPIRTPISFRDISKLSIEPSDTVKVGDISDAFTGEPIKGSSLTYRCQTCQVSYQVSSYEFLKLENGGRCVSCGTVAIALSTDVNSIQIIRSHNAEVVTLTNYRQFVGKVVTFEGSVSKINVSRTGKSYAIMFENKSWTKGFKMVVFARHVADVGGVSFINSLIHRRIRVRGLLQRHGVYGYQIIVTKQSMVSGVR